MPSSSRTASGLCAFARHAPTSSVRRNIRLGRRHAVVAMDGGERAGTSLGGSPHRPPVRTRPSAVVSPTRPRRPSSAPSTPRRRRRARRGDGRRASGARRSRGGPPSRRRRRTRETAKPSSWPITAPTGGTCRGTSPRRLGSAWLGSLAIIRSVRRAKCPPTACSLHASPAKEPAAAPGRAGRRARGRRRRRARATGAAACGARRSRACGRRASPRATGRRRRRAPRKATVAAGVSTRAIDCETYPSAVSQPQPARAGAAGASCSRPGPAPAPARTRAPTSTRRRLAVDVHQPAEREVGAVAPAEQLDEERARPPRPQSRSALERLPPVRDAQNSRRRASGSSGRGRRARGPRAPRARRGGSSRRAGPSKSHDVTMTCDAPRSSHSAAFAAVTPPPTCSPPGRPERAARAASMAARAELDDVAARQFVAAVHLRVVLRAQVAHEVLGRGTKVHRPAASHEQSA